MVRDEKSIYDFGHGIQSKQIFITYFLSIWNAFDSLYEK
jgi:hypothetical protein